MSVSQVSRVRCECFCFWKLSALSYFCLGSWFQVVFLFLQEIYTRCLLLYLFPDTGNRNMSQVSAQFLDTVTLVQVSGDGATGVIYFSVFE